MWHDAPRRGFELTTRSVVPCWNRIGSRRSVEDARMSEGCRDERSRWIGIAAACALLALAGCETFRGQAEDLPPAATITPPALPGKSGAQRVSQFVFYSDTPLKSNAPLLEELSQLREQLFRELQLPPTNSVVQVYLFDDQEHYEKYMRYRYPELPKRRAFFVSHPSTPGGPRELLVFTYWGDHLRQDLRHELTHALLNSVLREVPLWLDEGLAEFFELPPERDGLNSLHVDALLRSGLAPDLAGLERLDQVQQMGRAQYQESWGWVHLMLRSTPRARGVLLSYLQHLREPTPAGSIVPALRQVYSSPGDALAVHLAALDAPAATIRTVVGGR
jgi:hypothetical protein